MWSEYSSLHSGPSLGSFGGGDHKMGNDYGKSFKILAQLCARALVEVNRRALFSRGPRISPLDCLKTAFTILQSCQTQDSKGSESGKSVESCTALIFMFMNQCLWNKSVPLGSVKFIWLIPGYKSSLRTFVLDNQHVFKYTLLPFDFWR